MAASRTAQFVALYRALEYRERTRPRLFEDPFAGAFLSRTYRLLLWATRMKKVHGWLCRYADLRAPGARTSAIARTRFIDDLVKRSVADDIRQVVVLGAGFDSRAHRMVELGANDYRARYLPAEPNGYPGFAFYRLAVATQPTTATE